MSIIYLFSCDRCEYTQQVRARCIAEASRKIVEEGWHQLGLSMLDLCPNCVDRHRKNNPNDPDKEEHRLP